MSLCGHEGTHRERTRPAPTPHRCLCTFCDRELFQGWLARTKALRGRAGGNAKRDELLGEVWDSMIQRNEAGIGMTLAGVAAALYTNDREDAARFLEDLCDDEEALQAHLDPADRFRGCPTKPLAPTPLFDGGRP